MSRVVEAVDQEVSRWPQFRAVQAGTKAKYRGAAWTVPVLAREAVLAQPLTPESRPIAFSPTG